MSCREEMGPESATSPLGQRLGRAQAQNQAAGTVWPAERAPPEADDGRRGPGDLVGAWRPAPGDVFTQPDARRTAAHGADVWAHVEAWLPTAGALVYALGDTLSAHRATEVWLFSVTPTRWEVVFPPQDAAALNLIEPWWQGLRSLARNGRRVETWAAGCQAVAAATA